MKPRVGGRANWFGGLAFIAGLLTLEPLALVAAPAETEFNIVGRGPHDARWERTVTEVLPDGRTVTRRRSFVQLESGMHYWSGGWTPSREQIEIFQGAAVARQGQHQVIFAANLLSPEGDIDLLSPDGKRFRTRVTGLAYIAANGQSVWIAQVKDSQGAVLPPNQVVYRDAFAGNGLVADVRFTWTKSALEQDIILLTAPRSPSAYGFNPETTRLAVITELIEAPEAIVTPVVLKYESDPIRRQQMAEPDLIDEYLDFGVMKLGPGLSFPLGQADPFDVAAVPTGKSLERIADRLCLVEKVDYRDIREHLAQLPQAAAVDPQPNLNGSPRSKSLLAGLPPRIPKGERRVWRANQYARVDPNRKGFRDRLDGGQRFVDQLHAARRQYDVHNGDGALLFHDRHRGERRVEGDERCSD
jgi:hypothetical protein